MLKQSLQYTGRSPLGRNGTMASLPHSAQLIGNISLGPSWYMPADLCSERLTARQLRQRLGSFPNPLAWKNSCSPAVNMNSPPHSTQLSVLSDNATGGPPVPSPLDWLLLVTWAGWNDFLRILHSLPKVGPGRAWGTLYLLMTPLQPHFASIYKLEMKGKPVL